jgi:hypothetical protein
MDTRSVFLEELHEDKSISTGAEYWYREQFAIRAGYFHEHMDKGNRKFATFGIGLKLNVFSLDFAYLVPFAQNSPLANTLRFTLGFDFDMIFLNKIRQLGPFWRSSIKSIFYKFRNPVKEDRNRI